VEAGTYRPSSSWGEGLFAGSSPVVDTNDRCVGMVKCAVSLTSHTSYPLAYEDETECSETSVIKHHTPGNNPNDYTQHLENGESLKSRSCTIPVTLALDCVRS
jgi:hypothetical protein